MLSGNRCVQVIDPAGMTFRSNILWHAL